MSRLVISFSGGRTSAYMTRRLLTGQAAARGYTEIAVIFANTGQEHEKTLEFVHQCDRQMHFDTHWIEAVPQEARKGTLAKRVDYPTASRQGAPFEAVIQKYGIPNKAFPHCTRELKQRPIEKYITRVLGWDEYDMAIGIRADERRRVSPSAVKHHIVYPLIDWEATDKPTILDWWKTQPFDLEIPEHLGNCVTCWKKSAKKLLRVAVEDPRRFDFMQRMEEEYGWVGPDIKQEPRVFFRERVSAVQILLEASLINPERLKREPLRPEEDGGCAESCELYPTEAV